MQKWYPFISIQKSYGYNIECYVNSISWFDMFPKVEWARGNKLVSTILHRSCLGAEKDPIILHGFLIWSNDYIYITYNRWVFNESNQCISVYMVLYRFNGSSFKNRENVTNAKTILTINTTFVFVICIEFLDKASHYHDFVESR